ncbi:MAG: hypothetical protein GY877_06480 [Hyphomicrobium sp.]|nr:hypothetical protein [Hyphomicrobium sp.]
MPAKVFSTAIIAGLLVAFATDDPPTKADCEQQGMKWDEASGKCMK